MFGPDALDLGFFPMQPVLKIVKRPTIRLDPNAITERPEVAARIAQCIACFSRVETTMSALFINILGVNMSKGAALYANLNSANNKDSALRSLALAALTDRELLAFEAVIKVVKTHQKTRDKLAHWYWGVCDELKDGLILINPRYLMRYRAEILDWRQKGDMRGAKIDHKEVYGVVCT